MLAFVCILIAPMLGKECNVLDYGAKGDGKTLDTEAIQDAINNCTSSTSDEMNVVLLPQNYNFLSFPLKLLNPNTEFRIDGTITAPMDYQNWPVSGSTYISLLTGKNINNSKITGNGLINGNGYYWYPLFKNKTLKYGRPWLIRVYNMNNFEVSGITLLNSPMFHLRVSGDNVTIHDVNITVRDTDGNPGNYSVAPNTDGMDVNGNNVHIYKLNYKQMLFK